MASFDLIVRFGGNRVTTDEPADCRGPPAEGCWNDVPNATGAEVDKDGTEHEAPESGEKIRQPQFEDPHFLELVELQRRMFQST